VSLSLRAASCLLLALASVAGAQEPVSPSTPSESTTPERKSNWLDATQETVYTSIWHSAMWLDRQFGSREPDVAYAQTSGSIAPALLWDQFHGFSELLRFHADVPLPQLNDRLHAFLGRVNPSEYISESQRASGAFANSYAPLTEDQTILGISYYTPVRQGGRFDAGAGVRITWPPDPYVKGGYVYELGTPDRGVFGLREILFYQDSQGGFGTTTRLDFERLFGPMLLVRWTGSTTIAQRSYGFKSYSTVDAFRAFSDRRALGLELFVEGTSGAQVPLYDYGVKVAFRHRLARDWLIMEVRTSLEWPKLYTYQERKASFGLGLGFEMFFGTDQFLARPVTF
jgi:hypothetical protein